MLQLWGRRNMIAQCLSVLNYPRSYCSVQENCRLLMFLWVTTTLFWCVCAAPTDAPGHGKYSCGYTAPLAPLLSCSDLLNSSSHWLLFWCVVFFFFLVAYGLHFCVILSLLVLCCSGNCQDIFRLIFPSSPLHYHHVVSVSFCSCFVSCVTETKENLPLWGSFQAKPACFKIGVGTSERGTPNDSVWITTALPLTVKGRAKTYSKSVGVFMSVHLHNVNSHSCATESNAGRYNVSPGKYLPRAETRSIMLVFLEPLAGKSNKVADFFSQKGFTLWGCLERRRREALAL